MRLGISYIFSFLYVDHIVKRNTCSAILSQSHANSILWLSQPITGTIEHCNIFKMIPFFILHASR